jgi:DNA (cytosine-5)-methyltransferase 1
MPVVVPTGNGASLVAAHLSTYYGDRPARVEDLVAPIRTQTTENRHAVVSAFLAKHYGGVVGSGLDEPKSTVTTIDHDSLVAASLAKLRGTNDAANPAAPLHTLSAGGQHHALVYSFLQKYYGTEQDPQLREPLHTVTTIDRFGLVTVTVNGEPYYIADIAMRMLQPRELYRAQGFPDSYVIDRCVDGRTLTKTEQVRMVGNSVCPPIAAALVRANCPELVARDEVAA